MRVFRLFSFFALAASLAPAQTPAHWDYYGKTGPLGWGKLDPAYEACSQGKNSPHRYPRRSLNKRFSPRIPLHAAGTSRTLEIR